MKIFKQFFLKKNQKIDFKAKPNQILEKYDEIGKLVNKARTQKGLTIEELSRISRIPEYIINSIENNIESVRPKYPFIRSILIKLEECLSLRKDLLVGYLIKEVKNPKKHKMEIIISKFDFINTWKGTLIYFLLLISTLFILKRYYFLDINIINIQSVEETISDQ